MARDVLGGGRRAPLLKAPRPTAGWRLFHGPARLKAHSFTQQAKESGHIPPHGLQTPLRFTYAPGIDGLHPLLVGWSVMRGGDEKRASAMRGDADPDKPGGFETDVSRFPLVLILFPKHMSVAGINGHIAKLDRIFQERGPFALVADINPVDPSGVSAVLRKCFAEGVDQLALRGALRAEGVIASSTIVRGLFTAYTWFRERKSYPIACFASRDEGIAWAEEILRQPG